MMSPIYLEALFDWLMWQSKDKDGNPRNDKPISTWVVRPLLFAAGGTGAYFLGDKEWWAVALVMGGYFLALFPLLINWIKNKKPCYLSNGNPYDILMQRIPCAFRIWLLIWFALTMNCIYYWYELVNIW